MPSNLEHQERSFARWSDRAEDVHTFLDEPVKIFAGKHRYFRHTLKEVFLFVEHRHTLFKGKYDGTPLLLQNIILDHIKDDIEDSANSKTKVYFSQNKRDDGNEEKGTSYGSWQNGEIISEIIEVAKKYDGLFTTGDIYIEMKRICKSSILRQIEIGVKNGIFEKVLDFGVDSTKMRDERKRLITSKDYQKIRTRRKRGFMGTIYRLVNYSKEGSPPPT